MGNSILIKIKNRTAIWSSKLTSGIYPKKTKTLNLKRHIKKKKKGKGICTPTFTVLLFTIAKIWKQPTCPLIDEWLKKMQYTYIMEYWFNYEKRDLSICDNMDKSRRYAKWSKSDKDKYLWSHMWNLKIKQKTKTES